MQCLCNIPILHDKLFNDMVEDSLENFMDDLLVNEETFTTCLQYLEKVLARCQQTNVVLNWEICHFMVRRGIVLGCKISMVGIEVYKAKVQVIEGMSPLANLKGTLFIYQFNLNHLTFPFPLHFSKIRFCFFFSSFHCCYPTPKERRKRSLELHRFLFDFFKPMIIGNLLP